MLGRRPLKVGTSWLAGVPVVQVLASGHGHEGGMGTGE
jgi:hypothetical protein